jgi:diguanylate cyclase (GGDEF)-like protein
MAGSVRPPLPGRAASALAAVIALLLAGAAFGLIATSPDAGSAAELHDRGALAALATAGLAGLLALHLSRRQHGPEEPAPAVDPLTGLPTHAALRDRLAELLSLGDRQGWRVAVLVLDLRHFHDVNEAEGRAGGDLALRLVAARLRQGIRREDVVGRIAGDRFAVIQTSVREPADALNLAERLAEAVAVPLPLAGAQPVIAADIGLAVAPEDGTEACALLARAEEALAAARTAATPAIHCFAPGQAAALRRERQLERDLRQAVAEEAFALHFQPQRRLSDGRLLGFEALLRWRHPERGFVSPAEFIPLAERTGLIVPLGAWVLRQAATQCASWPAPLQVAVNLSPLQLREPGLAAVVTEALARARLAPERLELEITESVLIQDTEHAARVLRDLRSLGLPLALDDFGAGWSSLAHLRRFPFDRLKMDRFFLRDLAEDGRTQAVVGAILSLGRDLGMTVLAEGIETEAQAALLRRLGCDHGQGWLLGRPVPPEEAAALAQAEAARRAGHVTRAA